MTNMELIMIARLEAGIPEDVEVASMKEWNRRGKKVRQGETAVFKTRIWVPKTKAEIDKEIEEDRYNGNRFKFPMTGFFTESQVV